MTTKEQEILDQAIAAFQRETGLQAEKGPLQVRLNNGRIADNALRVFFPDRAMEYWAEVKTTVNNITVAQLAHQFEGDLDRWLLVTRYANPRIARTLREIGVQFIDTTGNVYINQPPILIFIETKTRPAVYAGSGEGGIWGRAAIKLVFALLDRRELLNAPYREMAEAANVALGTAVGVIKELMKRGYVVEVEKNRMFNRTEDLLYKWTTAYAERLRPKTLIGRYIAQRPDFWRNVEIDRLGALWGGETAAHWLTHFLKPEITTIYAKKPIHELLLNLKLRKNDDGDVVVRERFWEFENGGEYRSLVPPLLVYADLMATADARNIETAKLIFNEHLQGHLWKG